MKRTIYWNWDGYFSSSCVCLSGCGEEKTMCYLDGTKVIGDFKRLKSWIDSVVYWGL